MTPRATLFALGAVTAAALGTCSVFPVAFDEVTVKAGDQEVDGPHRPVAGAIDVRELHMDGEIDDKIFAAGYGEFSTGSGANVEALALAVPTNALPGPTLDALRLLLNGARGVFRDAQSEEWSDASRTVRAMNAAWQRYQAGGVPRLLKPLMAEALDDLTDAVADREPEASRQAALDVTRNGLDLLLQYRSRIEVDFARLDLWARQAIVDAEARDAATVASDVVILQWVLDRLAHTGDKRDRQDVRRIRQQLATLRAASKRGNLSAIVRAARHLQELLRDRHGEDTEGHDSDD